MDKTSTTKTFFHKILLALSSLPILLILLGILIELGKFIAYKIHPVYSGVVNVTIEHLVFMGGLYLAIPCGLIALVTAISAKSKAIISKKIAIPAIIIAVLSILFGILSLIYYAMVSSFVF